MLLLRKPRGCEQGLLAFRVDKFSRGEWVTLLEDNMLPRVGETSLRQNNVEGRQRRVAWSEAKCRGPERGDSCIYDVRHSERVARTDLGRVREVPAEVLNFAPRQPLVLDFQQVFGKCTSWVSSRARWQH